MDAPAEVHDYLERLVERLRAMVGEQLLGVYALGSLALGGFRPDRSDVDVLAVVVGPLDAYGLSVIADGCSHVSLPCPARRLELVVIGDQEAARPGAHPRWQLNLNTGAGMSDHVGLDPEAEPSHWFVLDLALARQSGVPLEGPAAEELIGPVEEDVVSAAQAEAVAWYALNEPGEAAVVAACRAWHWQETGRLAGKAEAVHWALGRL